jgi:hypothetical protein
VEAKLTSVPRSGRPDDPPNSRTPNLRPFSPFATPGASPGVGTYDGDDTELAPDGDTNFKVVETIMGQKRALTAVPRK